MSSIKNKAKTSQYVKDFTCLADACPDHCCGGWKVTIDNKTHDNLMAEMKTNSSNYFDRYDEHRYAIKQRNKECIFLTEKGLCTIHRDHGQSKLSNICRSFPKKGYHLPSGLEVTTFLSCPQVVHLLFAKKNSIEHCLIEDPFLISKAPVAPTIYWKMFPKVRAIFLKILHQTNTSLRDKIIDILDFSRQIDPFFHQQSTHSDVIKISQLSKEFFTNKNTVNWQNKNTPNFAKELQPYFSTLILNTPRDQKITPLLKDILFCYVPKNDIDLDKLIKVYIERKKFRFKDFSTTLEQCLTNLLHHHIMDCHWSIAGGWNRFFRIITWDIVILSILWVGHPKLNNAIEKPTLPEFLNAGTDVVYGFYRIEHFAKTWRILHQKILETTWYQEHPQEMLSLIR
jgi:hypothetical protein